MSATPASAFPRKALHAPTRNRTWPLTVFACPADEPPELHHLPRSRQPRCLPTSTPHNTPFPELRRLDNDAHSLLPSPASFPSPNSPSSSATRHPTPRTTIHDAPHASARDSPYPCPPGRTRPSHLAFTHTRPTHQSLSRSTTGPDPAQTPFQPITLPLLTRIHPSLTLSP
jgi:hypothetical protein